MDKRVGFSIVTLLILSSTAGATLPTAFGPDGTLRHRPEAHLASSPEADRLTPEFISSIRVDDDIQDEHREPAVVWGPEGELCAVYCERADHYNPERIMFTRSPDGGASWLAPAVLINNTSPNAAMMPAIDRLDDGSLIVAWAEMKFSPYNYEIRFSRSTDGGLTWSPSVVVHPIDDTEDYHRPDILAASSRILVSYWKAESYPNGLPMVVFSDDEGANWSEPVTMTTTLGRYDGAPPQLAHNPVDGEVGLVVMDTGVEVLFHRSTDLGATWSAPVAVNDAVAVTSRNYPDLDWGGGAWHVVWGDTRNGQYDVDIFSSSSADGGHFSADVKVNDGFGGNQYEPHVHVGPDDRLHVCWIWNLPFQGNIDLYYSCSDDGGTSWLATSPRVNDVPYAVQPYVTWTADLLGDGAGNAYVFWNDGRDTGYYDNIYFSRTVDLSRAEPAGLPAATGWRLSLAAHPGPDPRLRLRLPRAAPGVLLQLLDPSGRMVERSELGTLPAGEHEVALPRPGVTGTYFVRVSSGSPAITERMVCTR